MDVFVRKIHVSNYALCVCGGGGGGWGWKMKYPDNTEFILTFPLRMMAAMQSTTGTKNRIVQIRQLSPTASATLPATKKIILSAVVAY